MYFKICYSWTKKTVINAFYLTLLLTLITSVLETILNISNVTAIYLPLYSVKLLKKINCIIAILACTFLFISSTSMIQFNYKKDDGICLRLQTNCTQVICLDDSGAETKSESNTAFIAATVGVLVLILYLNIDR